MTKEATSTNQPDVYKNFYCLKAEEMLVHVFCNGIGRAPEAPQVLRVSAASTAVGASNKARWPFLAYVMLF